MKITGVDTVAIKKVTGVEMAAVAAAKVQPRGGQNTIEPGLPWYDSDNKVLGSKSLSFAQTTHLAADGYTAGFHAAEVPFHGNLNVDEGAFSIQAWVRQTGGTGNTRIVYSNRNTGNDNNGYMLQIDQAANAIKIWMYDSSWESITANSPTAFTNDTWYHTVFTFDGGATTNNGILYINGTAQSSKLSINSFTVNDTSPFLIGSNCDSDYDAFRGWVGNIDEVCYWNIALTSGNVTSLYNSGAGTAATGIASSNIVAYWTFEDDDRTVTDQKGNGHTATLKTYFP
tara:strand:- start:2854 stop:3708 length:855 start_codon:yes stop_codon:yes gene_type:complete